METLAEELEAQSIGSIFIYTHEAHPGEHFPHHTSFEQKLAHARAFREMFNLSRPILVDALDGACHRAYGGMPNMSWIFDRTGRALYKADWTSILSIQAALADMAAAVERRRDSGIPAAPFRVERVEYRPQDRVAFNKGLARNGPKAVTEFAEQSERWRKRE